MRFWADLYAQQFRTTLSSFVQYRASMLIWMIWQIIEPLIYLVVWSVVSSSTGGKVGGFTPGDFSAYFIAMMLVNHVTYTWIIYEFEYRVRHGSLSFALLKPIHPIHADLVSNVSSKLLTTPMMLLAAFLLVLAFPPSFHPMPAGLLLFVPALLLAFALRFLCEWTLALSAFWTTRVSAVNQGYYVLALFLSGQMAPLALLPAPVRLAADFLPLRWMISFPTEVILGRVSPADAAGGIALQAAWLLAAFGLWRVLWRAAVRTYTAVGA